MKLKIITYLEYLLVFLFFCSQKMINYNNIELYLLIPLIIILFNVTKDLKTNKLTIIFSIIFSLLISIGNLDIGENTIIIIFTIISELIGSYLIISKLLLFFQSKLSKINITTYNKKISPFEFIVVSAIIGFLCFMPYFLKHYPGILTYDSMQQMWQVTGRDAFSNHHPWIHTLLISLLYYIGYGITKSPNHGIAFYTVFQMLLVSISFSYVLYILYKNNIKKGILLIMWIFSFLLPYNAIYSITMWKDIPFSLIVLVLSTYLYDHYENKQTFNIKKIITITILSILLCLFRSNGLYAYIFSIIILLILYRKDFLRLKYSIAITLIIVIIFKGIIMPHFNVAKPNIVESLSIPAQQIAYVVKTDGNLSKKDIKSLKKFADIDEIKKQAKSKSNYYVSDEMKNNLSSTSKKNNNYLEKHKLDFFKLWFNIGKKNIFKYIKAFILQTSGYWYHNYGHFWVHPNSSIAYPQNIGSSEIIFESNLLSSKTSKLVDCAININDSIYYKIWSPAMSTYLLLIGLYITINKKKSPIPFIIPLAIIITLLIATPVACEFRYAYAIFLSAPILFIGALKNNKEAKYEKRK